MRVWILRAVDEERVDLGKRVGEDFRIAVVRDRSLQDRKSRRFARAEVVMPSPDERSKSHSLDMTAI